MPLYDPFAQIRPGYHLHQRTVRGGDHFTALFFDKMNQVLVDDFIVSSIEISENGYFRPLVSSVENRFFGIASGTVGTMRTLGMMVSMAIATFVFSIFIGRVQISPEKYPLLIKSISVAFIIFSILCFSGIFLSMTRGNLRSNKD